MFRGNRKKFFSKLFLISVICIFLFDTGFVFLGQADIAYFNLEKFDNLAYLIGQRYGSTSLMTWENGYDHNPGHPNATIQAVYIHSGPRCLTILPEISLYGQTQYFNLTSSVSEISNFSAYTYCYSASLIVCHWNFYNGSTMVIKMLYYYSSTGGWQLWSYGNDVGHTINVLSLPAAVYRIEFGKVMTNVIEYKAYGITDNLLGSYIGTNYEYPVKTYHTFTRFTTWVSASGAGSTIKIDDINITAGAGGGAGEGVCALSQYDYIGNINTNEHTFRTTKYIGMIYNVKSVCDIKGYDVWVTSYQKDNTVLSDYKLIINDIDFGSPSEFLAYQGGYLIRWCGFTFSITQGIVSWVYCSKGFNDIAIYSGDVDSDGHTYYVYGDSTTNYQYYTGKELSYRVFHTPIGYPDILCENNDYIFTDKATYDLAVDNLLVRIAYGISTKTYQNYVYIYNGTTGKSTGASQGFPKAVDDCEGWLGYVPTGAGTFYVKLRRNSVNISSYRFDVTGAIPTDFYIKSFPNPSDKGATWFINYTYTKPSGQKGLLMVTRTKDSLDTSTAIDYRIINSTVTNGVISETWSGADLCYVRLWIETSPEHYSPIYHSHIHYFGTTNVVASINVNKNIITIPKGADYATNFGYGTNPYVGFTVKVLLNGQPVADVSDYLDFTFSCKVYSSGNYIVELVLFGNGTQVLANTTFQCNDLNADGGVPTDAWAFLGDYRYVFAIGILLIFIFIPMFLASRLAIDVPALAYIASGCIGVAFCVMSGLIASYWLFFIVVTMVSTAIILVFLR